MGSCSSVHRTQEPSMKHGLSFGSKTDSKDKPSQWSPSQSTTTFKDYGSKEEAFFDSRAWLDSDCEDDFYSVNGEFTPSRGTTPVHHTFVIPLGNKSPSTNVVPCSVPEVSPTEKKKSLLDLFRESIRENRGDDVENVAGDEKKEVKPVINDLLHKPAQSTLYISRANSACSSERSMNGDHASITEKSVKSVQCCLPSFASCRSFSDRRRKANPAVAQPMEKLDTDCNTMSNSSSTSWKVNSIK